VFDIAQVLNRENACTLDDIDLTKRKETLPYCMQWTAIQAFQKYNKKPHFFGFRPILTLIIDQSFTIGADSN